MNSLNIFLSIAFIFSIIFNYLKLSKQKKAFQIVNDMGIGYNLGNSFDCYDPYINIETPDEQITLNENPIPTKELILRLKKYGFKTIRVPITWINFIDEKGNINSEWLYRIKEIVTWIINAKMYCIINVHSDANSEHWLNGLESKDMYINLWSQIANEFKDYDEHLIFESMNQPDFFDYDTYNYDYKTLLILTQAFIDTIRNSDSMNKQRLLIFTAPYADLDTAYLEEFMLPKDPFNKLAFSLQYYKPSSFTLGNYFDPWIETDEFGDTMEWKPDLDWGNDNDYYQLFSDFNLIKSKFLDKNIPVIITATGVLTEDKKELKSIREYLYNIFSLSTEYSGMMACLWDTSKNIIHTDDFSPYNMNYYNREKDMWFDEKLKNILLQISKRKYIKIKDYYIKSNKETLIELNNNQNYRLIIGKRKALKIILNTKLFGVIFKEIKLNIFCFNTAGNIVEIKYGKKNLKKEYDGTKSFIIDISDKNCKHEIVVEQYLGTKKLKFINLTVEFNETFPYFDYRTYKKDLENYIN